MKDHWYETPHPSRVRAFNRIVFDATAEDF